MSDDSLIDDLLSDWDEDGAKDEDVEANRPAPPSAKSSAPIEPVDDEDEAIDDGEALDDSLLDTADEPGDVDLTSMAIDLNKDDNEVNRIHMPPDEEDEDDEVHDEMEEWPEDEDDDEDDFEDDEDEEPSSSNVGIDDSDDSDDEDSDDGNDSEDEDNLDDSDDDWGESDEEGSDEDLDDEDDDTPVSSRFRPHHDDFEDEADTVSKPNRKSPYENDFDEDDNSEYDKDDFDEDGDASPEEEEDDEDDALPMPDIDEELQGMSMADDDSMAMDDYPEPSRPARPRRRRPRPIPDDDSYEDEDEEDSDDEEPIPIPTRRKGRTRRPDGMNHKRLRRPKPMHEDMEATEPEEPDEDTPEDDNGGRGLLGKVPHVHMPKFRKPTASSIINAPFNLFRKIRKARRMYWIASMVAGLLVALWSALNIGAATNKGGPTTEAVNEGSVDVASASWDKGKDQAEVMLRNKSDMIAHMAGKADVRTWSPDYRPASWVSPRVVASCPIPQQDIDPGKTKTITISMKDCKGKVHGVWPRVKVQLDYQ